MIKGLAITPPVIGRISIGRVVEKNGKRLPEKDDQFTLTTQIQQQDGWLLHPLDKELREQQKGAKQKLRSIPIQLLFNDPELNLRVEYSLFDRTNGRPICVGNGESCQRQTQEGINTLPCPSPAHCEFGKGGLCKPYGRLNVKVGDDDEVGTFIFRTTGFNSIRALAARLSYYQAISGNLLASLPLSLKLRGKSTTQSYRKPIYYVDIVIREGMSLAEAIAQAKEIDATRKDYGYDQAALDNAARLGFANSTFEYDDDEATAIVEEFYPEGDSVTLDDGISQVLPIKSTSLKDKLEQQVVNES